MYQCRIEKMNRPYILDPALYSWTSALQANWPVIKEEYDQFIKHISEFGFETRTLTVKLNESGIYSFVREVDPLSIIVRDCKTNEQIDAEFYTTTTLEDSTPIPVESVSNYIRVASHTDMTVSLTYSYNALTAFKEKIYDGQWVPIAIFRFGAVNQELKQFFPRTLNLINSIPGMESAVYSILEPGTIIHPHKGYSSDVLRLHLGLTPYQDAALKVGDQILTWDEGSVFIFDDTETHEVWHKGNATRISFIVDFRRDPTAIAAYPEFIQRRRRENRILDMLKGKLK